MLLLLRGGLPLELAHPHHNPRPLLHLLRRPLVQEEEQGQRGQELGAVPLLPPLLRLLLLLAQARAWAQVQQQLLHPRVLCALTQVGHLNWQHPYPLSPLTCTGPSPPPLPLPPLLLLLLLPLLLVRVQVQVGRARKQPREPPPPPLLPPPQPVRMPKQRPVQFSLKPLGSSLPLCPPRPHPRPLPPLLLPRPLKGTCRCGGSILIAPCQCPQRPLDTRGTRFHL